MSARRVWVRPGGRVLAHDRDGWPLPAGHVDTVQDVCGGRWLWDRTDVWPCHDTRVCQRLAAWRTVEPRGAATFRGFYCYSHLPHAKPPDEPSPTCRVCGGPMAFAGYETHPGCDDNDDDNDEAFDAAVRLLSDELQARTIDTLAGGGT